MTVNGMDSNSLEFYYGNCSYCGYVGLLKNKDTCITCFVKMNNKEEPMKEQMSKREAAERNIKAGGNQDKTGFSCYSCKLVKECNPFEKFLGNKGCVYFCKQWLADNPVENDWQELKIDNLPSGFFDGIYEFYREGYKLTILRTRADAINVIFSLRIGIKWYFRKRQPEKTGDTVTLCEVKIDTEKLQKILNESIKNGKVTITNFSEKKQPSHEEIMTKWWFDKAGNWEKVTGYAPSEKIIMYRLHNSWVRKDYFLDLESATIPPEENQC